MTLQVRNYTAIAAQMVAELAAVARDKITDFTEGAVARSLLEVAADEIQRLEVGLFQGVREGTLVGTYRTFDFARLPAVPAAGSVQFSRVDPGASIPIPLGQVVRVPTSAERQYATTAAATLVGLTVEVPVRCLTAGTIGNTAAGTIIELGAPLTGVDAVTNLEPLLIGQEQESDDARLLRFRAYIAGLSRATRVAIEGAARGVTLTDEAGAVIERVTGVYVREPFLESPGGFHGLVQVYVDNGAGSASADLLTRVDQVLRGYRDPETGARVPGWVAAGIDLDVFAVTPIALDVVAQVTVQEGFEAGAVRTAVQSAIEAYLLSLQVFQPAVHAELVAAAMAVDGVTDVTVAEPLGNTLATYNQRVIPGTIVVTSA